MTKLSIALGDYPHARPLLAGDELLASYELRPVEVKPIIGAYRRMIRELEFDICELAPVTYLMAREAGIPITAVPVFLNRRFHHGDIQCAPDSGVRVPKDLEGRRVGVRAYTVSTGVWGRGLLAEEYGVDLSTITSVVDDEDHVRVELPETVERVTDGRSLGQLLADGDIAAAFTGNAGTGRAGAPREGWSEQAAAPAVTSGEPYPLFDRADEIAAESYARTGVYPLHSVVVLKQELADADPDLPSALFDALRRSKSRYLTHDPQWSEQPRLSRQADQIGGDPVPYGITANEASLLALSRLSHAQGLIGDPSIDALFAPGDYT